MYFYSSFVGPSLEEIWSKFMFVNSETNQIYSLGNIPNTIKKLPLFMIITGLILSFLVYFRFSQSIPLIKQKLHLIITFFYRKCFIDELYQMILIKPSIYLGRGFWKSIDIDLIDNLGPNGISRLVNSFGFMVSKLQSGYLYHYVLSVVIGLTLFISIYIYIF